MTTNNEQADELRTKLKDLMRPEKTDLDVIEARTDDLINLIARHTKEAVKWVIGENVKPDFDDEDWFCQRCNFSPTDGSKDCICKYNNRLKNRQRKRLAELAVQKRKDS